eukprot:CAMPEP_0176310458 /NCGR_PEP_ID=MMETSP0121_2-20121125/65614_1 /TAXON_ID=160619 /ORGANISM="Kryptoperidinium foliaceum, Strain CCMP 1326" /LENGTH=154 /DNA_ID=CAMNT_0017652411 /DNA_START=33 /DNA_END=495 /DNA_ORIENTATION=-
MAAHSAAAPMPAHRPGASGRPAAARASVAPWRARPIASHGLAALARAVRAMHAFAKVFAQGAAARPAPNGARRPPPFAFEVFLALCAAPRAILEAQVWLVCRAFGPGFRRYPATSLGLPARLWPCPGGLVVPYLAHPAGAERAFRPGKSSRRSV